MDSGYCIAIRREDRVVLCIELSCVLRRRMFPMRDVKCPISHCDRVKCVEGKCAEVEVSYNTFFNSHQCLRYMHAYVFEMNL